MNEPPANKTPETEGPLERAAVVREAPFRSSVPLLGPAIARLRDAWNRVAARWAVLPLIEQQNAFNRLAAAEIRLLEERLIAQDRLQTELTHRLAELTVQLAQLRRQHEGDAQEAADAAGPSRPHGAPTGAAQDQT